MGFLSIILLVTVFVSYQAMQRPAVREKMLYEPYRVKALNEWHRVFSHALIHADYTHLFVNAFVLWQFGMRLESMFVSQGQPLEFALLYIGGIAFAAIPGMLRHHDNPHYRSLGASGAVSAVLIAYILHFPTTELLLFFVIPMPAFVAGILFFVYEHKMDQRGGSHVAHDAHLWGGIFGLLFTVFTAPETLPQFAAAVWAYLPF